MTTFWEPPRPDGLLGVVCETQELGLVFGVVQERKDEQGRWRHPEGTSITLHHVRVISHPPDQDAEDFADMMLEISMEGKYIPGISVGEVLGTRTFDFYLGFIVCSKKALTELGGHIDWENIKNVSQSVGDA